MQDKEFDKVLQGPMRVRPGKFTKWDKINIKGPLTISQLIDKIQNDLKMSVSIVSYGPNTLYASFMPNAKKRFEMVIDEAIEEIDKKKIPDFKKYIGLTVLGEDEEGVDVVIPTIKYERK